MFLILGCDKILSTEICIKLNGKYVTLEAGKGYYVSKPEISSQWKDSE